MTKKPLDTRQLVNSEEDFGTMYEANAPLIHRFMFWRTKDQMLADDLTSTVFEKAWRSRSSFKGGSVKAWLYKIAHNTLIDHWRKRKELVVEDITVFQVEDETLNLDKELDQELVIAQLQVALSKLPTDMQTLLKLRFVEGLSCRDVATKLNLSEANVRVIQYRALQKLRGYVR